MLIGEDSEAGYRQALHRAREMPLEARRMMLEAGRELFAMVGPSGYRALIEHAMQPRSEGGDGHQR